MADREQTLLFIVDVRVNNARALQALGRDMREELGARQDRLVALGNAAENAAAGHQSLADAIDQSNLAAARPISTPGSQSGVTFAGARGKRDVGSKTNPLVEAQESGQAAGLGTMAAAVGDKTTSQQQRTSTITPAVTTGIPSSTDRQFLDSAVTQVAQKALKPENDRVLNAIQTEQQLRKNVGGPPLGQELVDTLAAVHAQRAAAPVTRTLTAAETAGRLGVSTAAARDLAAQGHLPGARKESGQWVIPEDVVTHMVAQSGGGGGGAGGVPPTSRGGGGGPFFFDGGGGGAGGPGNRRIMFNPFSGLTSRGQGSPFTLRNLFFGNSGNGGAFGLPALGSIGSLGGLGLEHWLLTALGVTASAGSAVAGAGLLGTAGLTTALIGGGSDALVSQATASQTKNLIQAQNALNTAVATYGKNSTQARVAQSQLNQAIQALGGGPAKQAIQGLAAQVDNLSDSFNKDSNAARAASAGVMSQVVQLAQDYVPLVTSAAQRNLTIINTNIKPLFTWLEGPQGIGIFNTLENKFASDLPTSIHAGSMAVEDFLRLMQATAPFIGGFAKTLDNFFTNKNQESAGQYRNEVEKLVGDFDRWKALVKILMQDLDLLFHADAGTANSIVGELTHMLTKLHQWETSVQGQTQLDTIFAVHKQQIDELLKVLPTLLKGYGSFYLDAAPAIVTAITDIAKAINFLAGAVEKVPGGGELVGLALVLGKLGVLGPGLKATGAALGLIATGEKDMTAASGGPTALTGAKGAATGTGVREGEGAIGTAEAGGAGIAGGSLLAKILGRLSSTGLGRAAAGATETGALGAASAAEGAGAGGIADLLAGGGAALAPVVAAVVPLAAVALGAYGGYRFLKTAFGNTPSTNTTTDNAAQLRTALQQGANQVPGHAGGLPLTPSSQRFFGQFGRSSTSVSISGLGDTKQAQADYQQFQNTMRNTQAVSKMSASQLEGMVREGQALAKVFPQFADQIHTFVKRAQTDLNPIQSAMRTMTARWQSDGKAGLGRLVDTFTQNIALLDNTVGGFAGKRLIRDDVNAMVAELTAGMASGRISVSKGMEEVNAALDAGLTNGAITWEQKWHQMFATVQQLYASGKISASQYQTDLHAIMLGGLSKIDNDSQSAVGKMNAHLKQLFSEGEDGIVQTRGQLNAQLKTKDAQMNAQAGQDMIDYAATLAAGIKGSGAAATAGINAILATLNKALKELGQSPISQVQLQAATGQGQLSTKISSEANTVPNAPSNPFTNTFGKGLATGGMMVNQPMFMLGEEAPAHPEYVIPTNPAYRPRALDLWMSVGHDLGIPGFASGGIAAPHVRGGGGFGAEVRGSLAKVAAAANAILGAKEASVGGGGRGGRVAAGHAGATSVSGSHASLIAEGLRAAGLPVSAANITAVATIVAGEDPGWDPSIVNKWDSNWAAGHPSVGIMQTIAGTFQKYVPGGIPTGSMLYGVGTNPIAQIAAGARYAVATYGSLQNVPGVVAVGSGRPYVGYARGGIIGRGVRGLASGGTTGAYFPTTYVHLPANLSPTTNVNLTIQGFVNALTKALQGEDFEHALAVAAHYAATSAAAVPAAPRLANAALSVAVTKLTNAVSNLQTSQGNVLSLATGLQGLHAGTSLASLGLTGAALTAAGITRSQARGLMGGGGHSYGILAKIDQAQAGQLRSQQAELESAYAEAVKQHNKTLQVALIGQLQAVDGELTTAIQGSQAAIAQQVADRVKPTIVKITTSGLIQALTKSLAHGSITEAVQEAAHYATAPTSGPFANRAASSRLSSDALRIAVEKLTKSLDGGSAAGALHAAAGYAGSSLPNAIASKLANTALSIAVTKTSNAISSVQTSQGNTSSLAGALQGLLPGTTLKSLGLTGLGLTASGLTKGQARSLVGGSPASYATLAKIYEGQAGELKGEQSQLEAEYKQAVKQHNKKLQASLKGQLQGVDDALATAVSNGQQALQQETQAKITDIQTRVGNLTNFQGVTSSLATALQGLQPGTSLSALGNLSAITASTAGGLSPSLISQLVGGGPGSYTALAGLYQGQAGTLQAQQSQLMGELTAANQSGNSDLATAIVTELQTVDQDLVGALSSAQQAIVQGIQAQGQAFDQIAQGFGTGQGILSQITNLAPGTDLSDLGITPAIAAALGLPAGYAGLEGTGITFLQNLQQTQGGVLTPAQLALATTGTGALNSGIGTEIGGYENELMYDEGQLPNLSGTDLTSMQSTIYGLISTIVGLKGTIQDNNDSLTQLTQSVNGNTNAVTNNTGAMTGQVSFTFQGQQYLASDTVVGLGVGS